MSPLDPQRLAVIREDPADAASRFTHPQAGPLVLRPLAPLDGDVFGRYLEALGPETRRRFGPHPHTKAVAHRPCSEAPASETLRLLVLREEADEAMGYFILHPGVRPAEVNRYAAYGIPLRSETDCTFAPSVADAYQGTGLGSAATVLILDMARGLGFDRMVLSGGTQATNDRAIGYYEKFGFRKVGSFETDTREYGRLDNHDMMLMLRTIETG